MIQKSNEYRYCLAENDLSIIKHYNGSKKISNNAEKSLIILSEVFGGLHHLDSDQLEIFDYQSTFFNQYLMHGSLSTFDNMDLTCLVIMAHDMAVRFEIQTHRLDPEDTNYDLKLLKKQWEDYIEEYGHHVTIEEYSKELRPYLKLLFHKRQREGDISQRHPTLEDSTKGFRDNNKRYA